MKAIVLGSKHAFEPPQCTMVLPESDDITISVTVGRGLLALRIIRHAQSQNRSGRDHHHRAIGAEPLLLTTRQCACNPPCFDG